MHKLSLNKKEKELIKELKELACLRMMQLSRDKQFLKNAKPMKKEVYCGFGHLCTLNTSSYMDNEVVLLLLVVIMETLPFVFIGSFN